MRVVCFGRRISLRRATARQEHRPYSEIRGYSFYETGLEVETATSLAQPDLCNQRAPRNTLNTRKENHRRETGFLSSPFGVIIEYRRVLPNFIISCVSRFSWLNPTELFRLSASETASSEVAGKELNSRRFLKCLSAVIATETSDRRQAIAVHDRGDTDAHSSRRSPALHRLRQMLPLARRAFPAAG